MPRPIWKGSISFGLVNVPVDLYPAEQRSDLHFTMLDSKDKSHVKYHRCSESSGREVPWNEIARAYEYDGNNYVIVEDDDFKRASAQTAQAIELEDFVDQKAIDYVYFDKPYYLVPGKRGEKGYVLLREALKRSGKVGVARVVIRTREHLAVFLPEGDALVLNLIRYDHEVRKPEEYNIPKGDMSEYKISDREVDLALQLIDSMATEWQPEKYKDVYRDKLLEVIERKIESGEKAIPPSEEGAGEPVGAGNVIDMMSLLKKSVEQKNEPAEKTEKKTASKRTKKRKTG
jgi:DNA end-binding protein Ku